MLKARKARKSLVDYCEFVGRDFDGSSYKVVPFQREWLDAILNHDRILIFAPPEHGKTALISNLFPAWWFGLHPEQLIGIVKREKVESEKSTQVVRSRIFENPYSKLVFQNIRPATGRMKVDRQDAFRIEGAASDHSQYSMQAFSYATVKSGVRFHVLIVDDILDIENTRSESQRQAVIEKWFQVIENRVLPGGKIIFLTNAHHPRDLAHHLAKNPLWHVIRTSAVTSASGDWEKDGVPLWPERWPIERLKEKLTLIGPIAFACKFLNKAIDESTQRFKEAWIARCLKNGLNREFLYESQLPGIRIGIDISTGEAEDLTAFFVMRNEGKQRLLIWLESGRFTGPEIIEKMNDFNRRYGNPIFYPESNAAQAFIEQFGRHLSGLNVSKFTTTGQNKWDESWGVESIAVELYNGYWILPSKGWTPNEDLHDLNGLHPELKALVDDMLCYRPNEHTPDRLMAMWIAREATRMNSYEPLQLGNMMDR